MWKYVLYIHLYSWTITHDLHMRNTRRTSTMQGSWYTIIFILYDLVTFMWRQYPKKWFIAPFLVRQGPGVGFVKVLGLAPSLSHYPTFKPIWRSYTAPKTVSTAPTVCRWWNNKQRTFVLIKPDQAGTMRLQQSHLHGNKGCESKARAACPEQSRLSGTRYQGTDTQTPRWKSSYPFTRK